MPARNQIAKNSNCSFSDLRHIEKLDHEGQVDIEAKNIVGADLSACTEAGDTTEYGDALNTVLILKQRQDLLH